MKEGGTLLDLIRIGNKLSDLRQQKGHTQESLAELLLVTHQAVSKWERGLSLPSVDNLCYLMEFYLVSIEEILCLDSPKTSDSIDELFKEHDRHFIVHETVQKRIEGVTLEDILHKLSNEERMYALYLLVSIKYKIDEKLWPRLSVDERYYIIHQHKEGNIPFDFDLLMHLMSKNEIKKYKGEI
ncbi:MAG: helix-turn-helix transcriptional regulator [Candidatus Izemoplasmatales bacterium]|jgi:transcriptional regulator with XRE-family HTH domain|nr:helix-turn-helix transcriptional regulator [Candidatus Izemoplasmatales bacterium]